MQTLAIGILAFTLSLGAAIPARGSKPWMSFLWPWWMTAAQGKAGWGIDPNGKPDDPSKAGVEIDPNGRSAQGKAGVQIDPNGKPEDPSKAGGAIDPSGIDPNGGH